MPAPSPSRSPRAVPAPRAPRRTRAEQGEFYERVVQTSLQLFADGGYAAVSMRKLAAEVGVPPMSLYRYFPTKAHLIRHIWDDVLDKAYARATADLARARSPLARLRSYLDGFLQYWLEHPSHYWVVFAIRDDIGELMTEEGAYTLHPNPQRFIQTLDELFDAVVPPASLSRGARQTAIDLVFVKTLGFLLGTIGLASLQWLNVSELKRQLIDDIVATLPVAAEAPAHGARRR
ncbi:MAG: TetR/AcrR family transcriptional regulator [Piscinibacter sp.]